VVNPLPGRLYPQERSPISLNRMGAPQNKYGKFGEKKLVLPMVIFEPRMVHPAA